MVREAGLEKADVVHLLFEYVYIDDSWPEL